MPLPTLVTTAKVSVIVLASRVFNNKNIIALALIFFNLIDVPKFVILDARGLWLTDPQRLPASAVVFAHPMGACYRHGVGIRLATFWRSPTVAGD